MSAKFDAAFTAVIGAEGGYTNDPHDKGNWTSGEIGVGECRGTKYGISAAAYPHVDIANLSLEGAKLLYANDYWSTIHGDELPDGVGADVFDMAVNQGVQYAARVLQKACGVDADGAIGPVTIAAAGTHDVKKLLKNIAVQRILHYVELPGWSRYQHSWVDRTIESLIAALGV